MAYKDYGTGGKATLMKYNGSNWVSVGLPGFSSASVNYTSLALDSNGSLYVAYMDNGSPYKATVMNFIPSDLEGTSTYQWYRS